MEQTEYDDKSKTSEIALENDEISQQRGDSNQKAGGEESFIKLEQMLDDEPNKTNAEQSNKSDEIETTPNLSEELAKAGKEGEGSLGSLSDEDICDDAFQGDTWIEELECALLADCDPLTLKKICEGKRIPETLRPDYWRALLALNDAGKIKLNQIFDLDNQDEIKHDCEKLVEDIDTNLVSERLSDKDKSRLLLDFESTLTTYVKARPELSYVSGNGWTDILRVLYHLELEDTQLYQFFFRIVDRYIPKDLSVKRQAPKPDNTKKLLDSSGANQPSKTNVNSRADESKSMSDNKKKQAIDSSNESINPIPNTHAQNDNQDLKSKSIQAYHLLRLLIQYHDPELCSILDSKKIVPNLYAKDWFCSLFARSCSPKLALQIWDTHFKMADPFLIFFAAIVMVVNASDELKKGNLSQSGMLDVLKGMPSKLQEDDIEDLYYLVSNHYTNSTPRSIRTYSHLFFMDTFGSTYSGNESPEEGQPLLDLKTTHLTDSLNLSHYLCLPIVPAEIFALDTAQLRSSPTSQANSSLRYFLVDCRPAEQYNAGHLTKAFHLDCSLMLREPSSFTTAVQALLAIQRQVVASKSNTGGQHLCFIGSGGSNEEEDQYVNMVVASFLQKYQKYVSIVVGGFDAIHNYVNTKSELKDSFNEYIADHNSELCKTCGSKSSTSFDKKLKKIDQSSSGIGSAQSLLASTTSFLRGDKSSLSASAIGKFTSNPQANLIAQSGASMFDKYTTAFASKSGVIKDFLIEKLNTTSIPSPTSLASAGSSGTRGHVSSQDKLGRRYTGGNLKYAIDDNDDDLNNRGERDMIVEPIQEIQIDVWQRQTKLLAFNKCSQIKGNAKYPGYIALSATHLWILREIPHNKGYASIAAKRPLDTVVQITSKRRQPDLIIFRYGYPNQSTNSSNSNQQQQSSTSEDNSSLDLQKIDSTVPATKGRPAPVSKSLPSIVASDHLHIPQAFELIRLIKREIVRIMDENSKDNESNNAPDHSSSVEQTSEDSSGKEQLQQEQQQQQHTKDNLGAEAQDENKRK